jgi:hypothetical protein
MGSVKNAVMVALAHHLIHHPRKADGVSYSILGDGLCTTSAESSSVSDSTDFSQR